MNVHCSVTPLFNCCKFKYQCFISKSLVGVLDNNNICSRHDIVEILLKLALNTNQLINQFKYQAFFLLLLFSEVYNK